MIEDTCASVDTGFNGYATGTTTNLKTGNIPTLAIGATLDESRESCAAVRCPLLATGSDGPMCYAQYGSQARGHSSGTASAARKKIDRTSPRAMVRAIADRVVSARAVRVGSIGDAAYMRRDVLFAFVDEARRVGLAVVGYTHGWRDTVAADLRTVLMASCDTLADVDAAKAEGWRPTVVVAGDDIARLEAGTLRSPQGTPILECPAIKAARKGVAEGVVTCNNCRLCDASKPGPAIGFVDHGPTSEVRKASVRARKARRMAAA
jgi:hypothetical protein